MLGLIMVYKYAFLSGFMAYVNNKGIDIKLRLFHTEIPLVVHLKNIIMGAKLTKKNRKKTEGFLITWKVLFGQLHIPWAAFLVLQIPRNSICHDRVGFAVNPVS